MSENNFLERGSVTISSNLDRATIAYPNNQTKHKLSLDVTEGGHLRGFVQPSTATDKLNLGAIKKQIKSGSFNPDLPDYARLAYSEVPDRDGVMTQVAEFVYDDIVMPDGKPLTMPASSPSAFLFTQKLVEMENKPLPDKGEKEEAAVHGYLTDINGKLYTPAAWRRRAKNGEMFLSGDCQEFDREKYLAAKGKKAKAPALDD